MTLIVKVHIDLTRVLEPPYSSHDLVGQIVREDVDVEKQLTGLRAMGYRVNELIIGLGDASDCPDCADREGA